MRDYCNSAPLGDSTVTLHTVCGKDSHGFQFKEVPQYVEQKKDLFNKMLLRYKLS